ncbi:MAG: hypothetical protein J6A30_09455 [Ruminococcus sp.]|nr:hypothetical protein [Ruminococcus sp.]
MTTKEQAEYIAGLLTEILKHIPLRAGLPREISSETVMSKASPNEIAWYFNGLQREKIKVYYEGGVYNV